MNDVPRHDSYRPTLQMLQHPAEIWPFLDWCRTRIWPLATVLEIGTGPGGLTQVWCDLVADPSGLGKVRVVSVDSTPGGVHGRLRDQWPCTFRGVAGDSHDPVVLDAVLRALGVSSLRDRPVDLLFIDGDHSAAGVRQDYVAYGPLVRQGGVIAFHDIDAFDYPEVQVPEFWKALDVPGKVEWSARAGWGGIGAVVL